MKQSKWLLLGVVLLITLVACGSRGNQGAVAQPTPVPTADPYEEALQAAQQYLEAHLGRQLGEITVAYGLSEWPDTSLGCPVDGKEYTQEVTAGYQFEITVDGENYELHTDSNGSLVVLCPKKAEKAIDWSLTAREAAKGLLAEQLGVDPAAMPEPIIAQAATWGSSALGCPQTGMAYTDVVVVGYQFTFDYDGVTYDVRASEDGEWGTICLPEETAEGEEPAPSIPAGVQAPLTAARQLLAEKLGLPLETLILDAVTWEPITFASSALGCPQPETVYLDVLTDGFTFILAFQGESYEVHTDVAGGTTAWCSEEPVLETEEAFDPTPPGAPAGMVFTSYASEALGFGVSYPLNWVVQPGEAESEVYFGPAGGDPNSGMLILRLDGVVSDTETLLSDYRANLYANDPSAIERDVPEWVSGDGISQQFVRDVEGVQIVERVTIFAQGYRITQWVPAVEWRAWDEPFLQMLESLVLNLVP